MVADLTGDPGGETSTEASEAQVDLAVRGRLPLPLTSRRWEVYEELPHPPLPRPALGADGEELGRPQADGVGLGPDQVRLRGELRGGHPVPELAHRPVRPPVLPLPEQGLELR